ncbi:hypothetical protein R5P91_03940 [Oenococcus oeni]|uniref:hypothetical protein n=1 Tax=Oenococcus oeni TaxID=1247 RepID=UPI000277B7B5|nr:hypothetical protein [Oenococcus oeni]KGH53703.1 hypothetical protein X299_05710 [Oenococcus oeni IOEB_S277]KGH83712.1 hypothetical protein X460_03250 [Oenococcus oeni S15]KGH92047.1 hypothetical protein X461_03655 [Oenococcus oeni S161]KGH98985.1 hypothetical protein X283_02830 [Oenococcus oeni IOEB_1491]KGH99725.1 hypothetical protein X295_05220 [Oenococcus oeni IOEB_L18_3]KGI01454.1 hypothetical protein X298_08225 [Oenococcus oeni IOEB_L65_2]KGI05196.1 hypothetical protein X462_05010 [
MAKFKKNDNFFQNETEKIFNYLKNELNILRKTFFAIKKLIGSKPTQEKNLSELSDHFQRSKEEIDKSKTKLNEDIRSLENELSTVKYPFHKK